MINCSVTIIQPSSTCTARPATGARTTGGHICQIFSVDIVNIFTLRLGLYRVLTGLGYNVVTFDYRGYGDSVPSAAAPSVARVVEDAGAVYSWLLANTAGAGAGGRVLVK